VEEAGAEAAPAKLNLHLAVLGRRADGFHELDGLMVRLDLADEVSFEPAPGPEDRLFFEDHIGAPLSVVPDEGFAGPDNLVLRALAAFRALTGRPSGPRQARLVKRIPLGAGLGGGSSDAAATLRLLNRGRTLPPDELARLALSLGADVPFFLQKAPRCRARGLGERLAAHEGPLPGSEAVLINPGLSLSTAMVFRQLGLTKPTGRNNLSANVRRSVGRAEAPGVVFGRLETGFFGRNDLWPAAVELCPDLKAVRAAVSGVAPAPQACGLSGSGPTFWALYADREQARVAARRLARPRWWVKLASVTS
jgi:4-diphosphocytidyl-2-C-methyl-D-erythritol kinase